MKINLNHGSFTQQKTKKMNLETTITCPNCGFTQTEKMPQDSCQYFWECPSCGKVSKPQKATVACIALTLIHPVLLFNKPRPTNRYLNENGVVPQEYKTR